MLIDALVAHFTHNRQRYDKNARLAQQGRAIPALLDELMRDPYLKLPPPKSTGREYYGASISKNFCAWAAATKPNQRPDPRRHPLHCALHRRRPKPLRPPQNQNPPTHHLRGWCHNPLIMGQISAALPRIK